MFLFLFLSKSLTRRPCGWTFYRYPLKDEWIIVKILYKSKKEHVLLSKSSTKSPYGYFLKDGWIVGNITHKNRQKFQGSVQSLIWVNLFDFKCRRTGSLMAFSMILDRTEGIAMGRQIFTLEESNFFIGWILTSFQASENIPELQESLYNLDGRGPSSGAHFLMRMAGISSGPVEELVFRFRMI